MLSLPLLPPPDDNTPWLRSGYRPRGESPPPHAANGSITVQGQLTHQQRQQRQQRDEEKRLNAAHSPLTLLAADEAAIAQRKAAIRNFGAYWIRPPGISKTLQSMTEEEVEHREQEELERQERGLLDLQAQQQLQEAQQRAAETAAEEEAGDAPEEHDLDEDVPEAEGNSTFDDASLDEDSHVDGHRQQVYEELEEAELTGVIRDEEELGIEHERDLDDSVPEAASYQATDSEGMDSSSETGVEDSFAMHNARRPTARARPTETGSPPMSQNQEHASLFDRSRMLQQTLGTGLPRSPGSMTLSSPHVESSFAASSPVRARAARNIRTSNRRGM